MEFPLDVTKPWVLTQMSVPSFFITLAFRIMANMSRKFDREGKHDVGAVFYRNKVHIYVPEPEKNMEHAMDSKKWHLKDSQLNRVFTSSPMTVVKKENLMTI